MNHLSSLTLPVVVLEALLDALPVDGEPLHHLVRVDRVTHHPIDELQPNMLT